ncbi:hypothetical protein HGRIS_012964 [Hohenbuehelia grisea]|uniref:DUF1776-domain-containing protein n=1 Tax=Hohenbuehelia grisea TaxID=104357 RepID=A0ABR3IU03_9AGAR
MVPTVEQIEEYIESLEELVFSSITIPEAPNVREAVNRIWVDISRYGPGLPSFPEVRIQALGDFEVPPPPPPPPPLLSSHSLLSRSTSWVGRHPWKACAGLTVGVIGAGLLVGYGNAYLKVSKKRVKSASDERRQVVVVLGGDTPLGLPLILELERKGYIVITSVSTPEAVEFIEGHCHGYVRALVLDPTEVLSDAHTDAVSVFLRSLTSTLSRRFPITAAGDPFAHPSSLPYIHSIVSLLSLTQAPSHAPLEHLPLRSSYVPYLGATHIAPLQVIQGLLPLLRTAPARAKDKGKKTVIICLPATAARIGLPFSSLQAMSAAATLRGAEVLRREIDVAALTDKSESMKNIKVVVVDVGAFEVEPAVPSLPPHDVYKAMESWTASEKVTYGPAFASIFREVQPQPHRFWSSFASLFTSGHRAGIARRGSGTAVFVNTLVGVVSDGRIGSSMLGIGPAVRKFYSWIAGKRIVVGAGANTYRVASHLPSIILDTLLMIPHVLISIRNALLPVQPYIRPSVPSTLPPPSSVPPPLDISSSEHEDSGHELSETGSEADVESNPGDGGEDGSWVSLKKRH